MSSNLGETEIREAVLEVAKLMSVSAKTAPKATGVDNVVIKIIHNRSDLERLARVMEELSTNYGAFFARDAGNVRNSDVVVLIGANVVDLGLKTPAWYKVDCSMAMALINLGIAVGSAVKTASMLNVDNRVMFSIGVAAQKSAFLKADFVLGIPLSAKAKNIYFDRK